MIIFILILIGMMLYYGLQFTKVISTLREDLIFPINEEEQLSIRSYPQKPVKSPTIEGQKGGLIGYVSVLFFVIGMFYFTWRYHTSPMMFTGYLLIMLPLIRIGNILNLFAVTKEGILTGAYFIQWKRIKSYELQVIDVNHKYYGHAKEVNDQYELIIHKKLRSHSCIITNEETKDKLIDLFHEKEIYERNPQASESL